ncbi:hypothetical protein TNCV_580881 [Trichonephila clavipes]|nr:hypothetical protein TNCV_580881 [Trichonephila clavipes]
MKRLSATLQLALILFARNFRCKHTLRWDCNKYVRDMLLLSQWKERESSSVAPSDSSKPKTLTTAERLRKKKLSNGENSAGSDCNLVPAEMDKLERYAKNP